MEKHIEKFLKDLKEQQDEIAKYLFGKSDIEVTCKIVYENVPTSFAYSEEGQQALKEAIQQLKENMTEENVKVSATVKIKDKPIVKKKGEKYGIK